MILYGDSKYENKVNKNILLASVNFVLSSRRFEDQLMWRSLHGKPYFFFQTSWKDRLSKQFALECELFCIIGKDDISFSWKYDLTPDGKWRMIFLKKYTEIWYFLQMFWKDGLFEKDRAGIWSFLYYLERWGFFPPKTGYFFPGRKMTEMIFLKKYTETWYFLFDMFHTASPPPYPLKVIDVLDRYLRKTSSNSVYFHEDLYRRFHILLSSEKNRKLNI